MIDFRTLRERTVEYLIARKHSYFMGLRALLVGKEPTLAFDMALADLARFCRATSDTIGETNRDTYILIGRRQVWLRITEHLHLTPERLLELYSSHRPPQEEVE